MKKSFMVGLLLVLLLFGVPWLMAPRSDKEGQSTPQEEFQGQRDADTAITVWDGTQNVTMTLAEYLPGVLRGEMPAAFEVEALKAQAIAERTNVYYGLHQKRKAAHPEADVCMSAACCAAYLTADAAAEKWGENVEEYEKKIRQAVSDTDGQVVLYDGQPIMAVFHSSSAGHTAKSGDVWTGDVPYLMSVTTPEGGSDVPNYYSVVAFSTGEFKEKVLAAYPEADLSGTPEGWITGMERTASDRVAAVSIGGVALTGTAVRSLLGLRSACFTAEVKGEEILFHVTGYGHGVGMSQYGANVMAGEGKTCREILQWYYTDVTIGGYTK